MPTSNAAGPKGTGGKSFPDYQRMAEERGDSPAFLTCDGVRIRPPPMDKAPPGVKAPPIPHPPVTHPAGISEPVWKNIFHDPEAKLEFVACL